MDLGSCSAGVQVGAVKCREGQTSKLQSHFVPRMSHEDFHWMLIRISANTTTVAQTRGAHTHTRTPQCVFCLLCVLIDKCLTKRTVCVYGNLPRISTLSVITPDQLIGFSPCGIRLDSFSLRSNSTRMRETSHKSEPCIHDWFVFLAHAPGGFRRRGVCRGRLRLWCGHQVEMDGGGWGCC